jgi:hypothetical protein
MEALDNALDAAQTELAAAEISLVEATARAEAAREAAARLKAAVAALSGEAPPAPEPLPKPLTELPPNDPPYEERAAAAAMTPEEFDADRKKRQRARQKELDAQNPYANVKCSGCGVIGKMVDQIIQAPSGVPVRMLVCNGCGNQIMQ